MPPNMVRPATTSAPRPGASPLMTASASLDLLPVRGRTRPRPTSPGRPASRRPRSRARPARPATTARNQNRSTSTARCRTSPGRSTPTAAPVHRSASSGRPSRMPSTWERWAVEATEAAASSLAVAGSDIVPPAVVPRPGRPVGRHTARRANHTRRAAGRGCRDNADVASPADREGDVVRPAGRVLRVRAGVSDRRGPNRRGCRRRTPRHRPRSRCRPWSSRNGHPCAPYRSAWDHRRVTRRAPAAASRPAPWRPPLPEPPRPEPPRPEPPALVRGAPPRPEPRPGPRLPCGRSCTGAASTTGSEKVRSPGASSRSSGWSASSRVVVGEMPALRVRSRTSRTWSSVISVMTVPVGAGARGAAGAVQVGLVLDRRVGVDDQADVVDVDAAGGDVRGDQRLRGAAGEGRHVAVTGVLRQVAVQLDRRHAEGVELLGRASWRRAWCG